MYKVVQISSIVTLNFDFKYLEQKYVFTLLLWIRIHIRISSGSALDIDSRILWTRI
jgi:hypothetical protein